ncbi:MAG: fused MFS/spermidine synthase [Sedimentisphaerales bacterium]|nr:fused MFS/spermidine synthase [Sedimentisphaerales bacterium]
MKRLGPILVLLGILSYSSAIQASQTVFQTTSAYHNIKVVDEDGMRYLYFDNTTESRMSLDNPLEGHFEYIEYFHMPWLLGQEIRTVVMLGLGGGSIQKAVEHYYPDVNIITVELDPKVVDVAKEYFHVRPSARHRIVIEDGRIFLRRSQQRFDLIIIDAYTANRYGSYIPYTLVTKEFFELVKQRLNPGGIMAYNVIGSIYGGSEDIVTVMYKTIKTTFKQVYLFPASTSRNVVLIAVDTDEPVDTTQLAKKAESLMAGKDRSYPGLLTRLKNLRTGAPLGTSRARILTDDFAPIDGLLKAE